MSQNNTETPKPPLGIYLDKVLKQITKTKSRSGCINSLIKAWNTNGIEMASSNLANSINHGKSWSLDARSAFPSPEALAFLEHCLSCSEYELWLSEMTRLFEQLYHEHHNNHSLSVAVAFLRDLNGFFDECNGVDNQRHLVALGMQATLCILSGIEDNLDYWRMKADSFLRNHNGDILQPLYKKSCEVYAQLLGRYENHKINQRMCPKVDIAPNSSVQIIGCGGSGKTTFLINQFKELLTAYEADSQNNPLPIYIPLNRYRGIAVHGKSFICHYIARNYAEVAIDAFEWSPSKYVLLLDGLNESAAADHLSEEIQNIIDLGGRILITTRYELNWQCLEQFVSIKLNELSDETIRLVLADKGLPMAEGKLLQTLRIPMFLALYLGITHTKDVNSPGGILREYHQYLLSKVKADVQGAEYAKKYTWAMSYIHLLADRTNTIVFHEDEIPFTYLPDKTSKNDFLDICVTTGLIRCLGADPYKGGMIYQWNHECFWEFYKAYSIFSALSQDIVPTVLESGPLSTTVASFLGDLLGEYRFETKSSCDNDMSPVEDWLQKHMRHDDIGSNYTDECRQMTTRNLIEVMKIARRNHISACYDGLDLSLTNFYDCALSNSSFDNAIVPESAIISQGHTSRIRQLAYLQEKDLLVTAGDDNQVLFWNTKTGTVTRTIKVSSRIAGLDISPDNVHVLILLERKQPAIMIVPLTERLPDIPLSAIDYSFAQFTANSECIICATESGTMHLLDAKTGSLVYPAIQLEQGLYDAPFEYGISSNRQFLVSGTTGGNIEVRRISNLGKPTTTLEFDSEDDHHVHNVAFTQNGQYCVAKNYNHLIAWNMKSKKRTPEKKAEIDLGNFMFQFVPAEDGVFFFDCGSNHLHFWDIAHDRFIGKDLPCNLCCMALSTDSKLLVIADENGKIYFVNPANYETVHTMWVGYTPRKSHYLHNRHYLGSEDVLFRRTWAGFFELYNRKKSQFTRVPIQPDPSLGTTTVPFWENWYCIDDYLCYVDEGICSIWSMSSGNHVQDVELRGYRIDAVIPQKDLIVGCNYLDSDYPICLWTLSTGQPLASLDTHGTWVCGMPANPEPMKIQNGNFWNQMSKFANVYGLMKEHFTHATFSALGIVVGGTENGTIRIWDLTSQKLLHEENIAASRITKLTPLAKSTIVVIQTENQSVVVYDIAAHCVIGFWEDNANTLRNARFLKFVTCNNGNFKDELVERDVMGMTVYRLHLGNGTLVSYVEDKYDDNIAVSQNGEWIAVNKLLQLPLPYKIVLCSVEKDEIITTPLTKHKLWPNCAFSPSDDGKYFLISNEAGAVSLLDSATGAELYEWAVCDARDISGCNFTNAILKGDIAKQLIHMNGGNL